MANYNYPTNRAVGTADPPGDHNNLAAFVNKFDTAVGTPTSGYLMIGNGTGWRKTNSGTPNPIIEGRPTIEGLECFGSDLFRIPVNFAIEMDGSLLTNSHLSDKVAFQNTVVFKGGFSGEAARALSNPGWLWGANDFIVTETASGAISGIDDMRARLTEVHIGSPNANLNTLYALQVDTEIDSTATSAVVDDMGGLYVKAPNNSAGGGVTVTNCATIRFGSPNVGTNKYGLLQEGEAKNQFQGDILMNNDPSAPHTMNAYEGTVRALNALVGPTASGDAGFTAVARFNVKSKADGDIVSHFAGRGGQTADIMRIATDTTIKSRFDKGGRLGIRVTSAPADGDVANSEAVLYVDDTAGNPKVMAKCKDSAGTVFTRQLSN